MASPRSMPRPASSRALLLAAQSGMRSRTRRLMARSACAIVLAAMALAGSLASAADAAPPPLWETDGSVSTIVESGGIVYIGGGFSYVGPHTGSGVVLSSESGAIVSRFPQVEGGRVSAAVRDGSEGGSSAVPSRASAASREAIWRTSG